MVTAEQLEAEVRTLPPHLSDDFFNAYLAFMSSNRRQQLALLALAYGPAIPPADQQLVEKQTAPVSRGKLRDLLTDLSVGERVGFARSLAETVANPTAIG